MGSAVFPAVQSSKMPGPERPVQKAVYVKSETGLIDLIKKNE